MRTSGERMFTTHTGSLPRPDTLRGDGAQPADEAMLREAVATVVGQQVGAGVDIVGDGEFSKPSYATYVADRLTGFGGMSTPFVSREMQRYPGATMRLASDPLIARTLMTPACVDRLGYRGQGLVERDIANLLAATETAGAGEAFMTAASPGVISWFYENRFYPSHEDYVGALAEAMKPEYDAIHQAGIVLQLDCPDLALAFNGWRDQPDIDLHGHRRRMAGQHRGAQPRHPRHPC
jgi:5-methyltetrahydropteroyltriglutamate--homocysteine methyltransferase